MGADLENINKFSCNLVEMIAVNFGIDKKTDVRALSPLTLAYIGDAVYELIIRSSLVLAEERTVDKFHKRCSLIVNASAQKDLIMKLLPELTEEEQGVFRRGRNAKSYSVPKNANLTDYRNATGFEALCGYLYLTDRMERLLWLVSHAESDDT